MPPGIRQLLRFLSLFVFLMTTLLACTFLVGPGVRSEPRVKHTALLYKQPVPDSVQVLVGTFLGGEQRNYYGDSIGDSLNLIWRSYLGSGTTIVSAERGVEEWAGAGWTGQPLLVREKEQLFLIQGCYDHHLKKIEAQTGALVWEYRFDDILKGTGTIWRNDSARDPLDRLVILQGSRIGAPMSAEDVHSYRAISYLRGEELWRMNVKRGPSYSRDVDGSALVLQDTAYLGLENASFIAFDPGRKTDSLNDSCRSPRIFQQLPLYAESDRARHGGNLVTEASPVKLGDHLYIASGSGHVYGYNLRTKSIDWDYFIGSDLDGTPVVTADSCLLIAVEKQYIAGQGGVLKLDPRKTPEEATVWYFPTGDFAFSSWKGGVIGSAAVNDAYNDGTLPRLAAFTGIDGWLCVVRYDSIVPGAAVPGPDGEKLFPTPFVQFKQNIGPSISTPVFSGNRLVAAGYAGIQLFAYDATGNFTQLAKRGGGFEATPVAHAGRIYIASRDGHLYCFGGAEISLPLLTKTAEKETPLLAANAAARTTPATATLPAKKERSFSYALASTKFLPRSVNKPKPILRAEEPLIAMAASAPARPEAKKAPAAVPAPPYESTMALESGPPKLRLIGGVFRSKSNAERNERTFQSKGVEACLYHSVNNGMYYVTLACGTNEEELELKRVQLQQELGVEVWMMH